MGGDHAPQAPIAGAIEALAELDATHSIQLIGRREVIEQELRRADRAPDAQRKRLEIVDALDSGANVDCSAEELVQFARLGAVYAEDILGRARPAVGLLSIGEEPEKGNTVTKEAHALLADSGMNFLGNCEGRDLPAGTCHHGDLDVVVCDGFVGNVILKFYEAVAPLMIRMLVKEGMQESSIRQA